ncbi:unnamed protein product [Psylliodes chrysocephalus]|uniref:Uncharacterized protein n=1 Tax=Psylliodes chrysocephalus TaxID=3402493 RepID=A0A9P0CP07_9CUCU|nr:unnamed protein product [Psylliodes chrysocephala]
MSALMDKIQNDVQYKTWRDLASITLTRVILFNKKRSGEAAKLTIDQYATRPTIEDNTEEILMSSPFTVNEYRALQYSPNGSVCYKLRFGDEWKLLPQRRELLLPRQFDNLPTLHSNRLPLNCLKFNDLQELKITIPFDYHSYYDNLPHN